MKKEVGIIVLHHNPNRNYIGAFTYLLNKIKPENKKICTLYYFTSYRNQIAIQSDIDSQLFKFRIDSGGGNYKEKLYASLELPEKYIMIVGEDFVMSNHVFDFLIENRDILDNNKNVQFVVPSNIGVPLCEYFIDTFCTEEEKNIVYKMFLSVDMQQVAQIWKVPEISSLNKYTIESNKWDFIAFDKAISQLKTHNKGIHPVRFSFDAQLYLSELVIEKMDKFLQKHDFEIENANIYYNCNDMTFHLNDTFRDIARLYSFSPYEEQPINLYRRHFGLDIKIVKYGYSYTELFAYNYYTRNDLDKQRKKIQNKFLVKLQECYKDFII